MKPLLTPGAQRAFAEAANWLPEADLAALEAAIGPSAELVLSPIGLAELVIGLLSEPDCRAAKMLAEIGVETVVVLDRWPDIVSLPVEDFLPLAGRRWSAEVEVAVAAAEKCLADYPRPLELATEHLLLGIASTETEVANWLRQRGLKRDRLEQEIHRLYGHQPGPLVVDWATLQSGKTENRKTEPIIRTAANPAAAHSSASRDAAADADTPIGVLRIIDAAANRAGEGLRVVEDFVRFALDDRHLTGLAKQLRHDLTAVLDRISTTDRMAARDTLADVGADVSTATEQDRPSTAAVVSAAFQRLQQALRSLEEFTKLFDAGAAAELESLRYRAYTLERAVITTDDSLDRLAAARLYVLLDGCGSLDELARLAETLVNAGVHVLQLRDKHLPDRQLLACARRLREVTASTPTLLIINDRPDLALLVGADGVHVGQDELCVKDVRRIVGPRMFVGVSTHAIAQARQAVVDGASYIGVGPTFSSSTKSFPELAGLALIREVAAEIRLPSFAIGGIGVENLADVMANGIRRVAVSGAVVSATDPAAAVRQMIARLE
jgi:thiamine-phosphate pyrophosphorylase